MSLAVLGAGDVGLACALALRASGARGVALLSRDGVLRKAQENLLRHTRGQVSGSSSGSVSAAHPAGLRVEVYPKLSGAAFTTSTATSAISAEAVAGAFVCTPTVALLTEKDSKKGGGEGSAAAQYLSQLSFTEERPFLACFTRGFGEDGETAAELVARAVSERPDGPAIPIFTATGPIVPREWLQRSLPRPRTEEAAVSHTEEAADSQGKGGALPPLSGTAISFALSAIVPPATRGEAEVPTPLLDADKGFHDAMEKHFAESLFSRESITYERGPRAGEVLAVVNGCLPLCAFGAGLVSNAYADASVSALGAYAQHCATATTGLVNGLVPDRACGTPLPMGAYAAIFTACNLYSAREFTLGRQMDFQFRQSDAVRAVYPGRTHEAFRACVDGLHTRMKAAQVASPFYEVLMDAFGTVLRASAVGQGLVRKGSYEYREPTMSPLLEHVMRVDEAMLSGDEARFDEAKRFLEDAFTMYPVRK